jgi:hypothetical protein
LPRPPSLPDAVGTGLAARAGLPPDAAAWWGGRHTENALIDIDR